MSYVSVVTDFFATRQGIHFSFTPDDYAAIAEWEKQGIPLAFVLDTIDRVIRDSELRSEPVRSIIDLNGSINSRFEDWLRNGQPVTSC
jgi:hypothetical protein